MANGLNQVLHDFLVESQENLERLDQEFVALEHEPHNEELLSSIFRALHSIKGGAGFLNLTHLEQISHYTEDVLTKLRDHSLALNTDITTALLHAVDGIKSILVHLGKTGEEGEHNMQEVVAALNDVLARNRKQKSSASRKKKSRMSRKKKPIPNPSQTDSGLTKNETPLPSPQGGNDTSLSSPQGGTDTPLHPPQGGNKAVEEWKKAYAEEAQAARDEKIAETVEDTRIHVDLGVLDQLMNLTGELVLARNRVVQFAGVERIDPQIFRAVSQRLNVVVSELQETMLKTRMQPVKRVFGILPRLVRDLSKAHGKEVELRLEGQDTELDRTLLEALKNPLTHLVRNAIDHGIESPEVRKRQGKPPTGTIIISAYHEGGQVHIDISDDGAGIDCEQIAAKAIKEGTITSQLAGEMSERDLLNLIFRPGFSTLTTVTDMSSCGVGLDVVKRNIDRIGGTVDVYTELHKGATIKLRIPITLAIIPVLIIVTANQRFAIPQVNLEELIMPQDGNGDGEELGIERVYGAEVYRLRGELLPLLRLNHILGLSTPEEPEQKDPNIVVVSTGIARFGIIVDDVGDTEEIVVKPLSSHIKQLPCYDGATIMGDGNVALILNVSGLFTVAQFDLQDMKQIERAQEEQENQPLVGSQGDQRQTIVLFRAGKHEYYGVPLAFVVRLEEFPVSQIEYSGGREVLQYRGDVLPLIRLEPHLNIAAAPDPEMLPLIVFSVEKQIGLAVNEIINTVEISTHIDTETFQQKGVLGSTIVNGHSVLILDIHGLIEMAYPTWYKTFFASKLDEAERKQIHVLLVEDSAFFLNIEKSYLESAGYQVSIAKNGNEALNILKE